MITQLTTQEAAFLKQLVENAMNSGVLVEILDQANVGGFEQTTDPEEWERQAEHAMSMALNLSATLDPRQ